MGMERQAVREGKDAKKYPGCAWRGTPARSERANNLERGKGVTGNGAGRWTNWMEVWIERRPAPLDLSDTEILDWLNEYCDQAVYNRPTPRYRGGFTLYCDELKITGATLRETVCFAAAKWKELNE